MTVIRSIGTGGTHDFTSLSAWAAALPADLVADGNAQVAQLYFNAPGDGEFLANSGSTLLNLTGHTTDPAHNITVTTGPGQSFRDNANAQTNPLAYDATKGVGLRVNTGYTSLITLADRDVVLSNLQINMDGGNADCIADGPARIDLQINNCLLVHRSFYNPTAAVKTFSSGQSTLVMRNCCVVLSPQAGNTLAIFSFNYANLYNCTVVVPQGSAGTNTYPVFLQYGVKSLIVDNCAFFGFANSANQTPSNSTTNATDLPSPPPGFTGSLTYAGQFVATTLGGYDFRPKPTGFLPDHATADTTNAAFDIVGTSRPQGAGWDIGCWELLAAGVESPAVGAAAGLGAASGTGAGTTSSPTTGATSGAGTAVASATSDARSVGTSAGLGTVSAAGTADVRSGGISAGLGTASGASSAGTSASAVGSAAGVGAASATVQADAIGVGASHAVGGAAAVGRDDGIAAGSAFGLGTAAATGRDDSIGVGNAAGIGRATGLADTGYARGNAAGIGTALGAGAQDIQFAGVAPGVGAAIGGSRRDAASTAIAGGIGAAKAQFVVIGLAAGTSTAVADGTSDKASKGVSLAVGITPGFADIEVHSTGVAAGIGHAISFSVEPGSVAKKIELRGYLSAPISLNGHLPPATVLTGSTS